MSFKVLLKKSVRFIAILTSIILVSMLSNIAHAKAKLTTMSDGVRVYSGPSLRYRPLAVLPAKTVLRAATQVVKSKDGDFYRVLVNLNEKNNSIGFVSVDADVRLIDDRINEDDLEKFGEVALIENAVQISYSAFPDDQSMISAGYMHYLSPGFYVKGFGGTFLAPGANAILAGGEIGNDALLIGILSGHVSYAAGIFAPATKGAIFDASSTLNAMMQATFGLRLNFGGNYSVSAGATQAVLFNANNSKVISGANLTLEIGL